MYKVAYGTENIEFTLSYSDRMRCTPNVGQDLAEGFGRSKIELIYKI
jgi:hypothetical protein